MCADPGKKKKLLLDTIEPKTKELRRQPRRVENMEKLVKKRFLSRVFRTRKIWIIKGT